MEYISLQFNKYKWTENNLFEKVLLLDLNVLNQNVEIPYEIIFCIDISGSMEKSILDVKNTLFAYRDLLVGSKENDDLLKNFKITLITFNKDAKICWSSGNLVLDSKDNKSFTQSVEEIIPQGQTNMGSALDLAYSVIEQNKSLFTSIILLTDGESNEGNYRTPQQFKNYISDKSIPNIKIFSIGYGNKYNIDVLKVLGHGDYLHIANSEQIPNVIGGVIGEIKTTLATYCDIKMETSSGDNSDIVSNDSLINPIIGNTSIGSLFMDRKYKLCFPIKDIYYNVTISYYDILEKEQKTIDYKIDNEIDEKIPDVNPEIIAMYYESQVNKIINNIVDMSKFDSNKFYSSENVINYVLDLVKDWTSDIAVINKNNLLKEVTEFLNKKKDKYEIRSVTQDSIRQNSYTSSFNMTNVQRNISSFIDTRSAVYKS